MPRPAEPIDTVTRGSLTVRLWPFPGKPRLASVELVFPHTIAGRKEPISLLLGEWRKATALSLLDALRSIPPDAFLELLTRYHIGNKLKPHSIPSFKVDIAALAETIAPMGNTHTREALFQSAACYLLQHMRSECEFALLFYDWRPHDVLPSPPDLHPLPQTRGGDDGGDPDNPPPL